jgi:hypothetical protein
MKVGDLVYCKTVPAYGLIMKIDRGSPTIGKYQQRYWVLIHGKKITFPFLESQLEIV